MTDIVQSIARARATMLLRGYEPLRLELGVQTAKTLGDSLAAADVLFYMPVVVRADMEGWAVVPDNT